MRPAGVTRLVLALLLPFVLVSPMLAMPGEDVAQGQERQGPVELDELLLRDGSRLYGAVVRDTPGEMVFRTEAGLVVTVPRSDVVRVRRMRGSIVDGEFRRADPNRTRLFFAPTGRAVDRGQVYAGVFSFVMPFVQVGLTDRLSVGGGTPLVFGISDWNRPFWVTPKLQVVSGERVQAAVGTLHVFDTSGNGGGIAYGVGTFGTNAAAITAGVGRTYTGFGGGRVLVMLGGERQVGRSVKLLTENYLRSSAGNAEGLASAGVRFFGERLSADVGLATPLGTGTFFVFPLVNFVYVF
jgi:hypothetical protein